jgi:predicted nucleic acid-binding protein
MSTATVADASTLIALAAAGAFEKLARLFGTLTITRLVKDEVSARPDRPGARALVAAKRAGRIRVAPTPLDTRRLTELDAGEASTIALAIERNGALVLMDDALGREQALALGLEVVDSAGVLRAAKQAGLV